jgi:hypothetical protein
VPTVYVADRYWGPHADLEEFASVAAHEMAHYMTYYRTHFNPSDLATSDAAAIAAVWDEARAYALEWFVQREINSTPGPKVNWMKPGQREALERRLAAADAIDRSDLTLETIEKVLNTAADALWCWAAKWTGGRDDDICYLQSYKNQWFDVARATPNYVITEANCDIDLDSIEATYAADGTVTAIAYRDDKGTVVRREWRDVYPQWIALYEQDRDIPEAAGGATRLA